MSSAVRNPTAQFANIEKLSNVARALLLALLSTLFVIFPTSGLEPATAAPNPAAINFNDGTCDLNSAGYLGSGSSADPYQVSDSDALWEVTDCSITASAAAHFQITNDIDVSQAASASTNSPIGYDASGDISFSGVIDGGNKVISGISMSASSYGVGLFAYLHNATISNLVISGSFVTTTNATSEEHSAGALAIRADGSLYLSSISNQASVTGKRHVGGLVGYADDNANIDSSHNTGTISGTANIVGGLVGRVGDDANINSSYNTGPLSGGSSQVGGLVGRVVANANITSSYNTGPVSGSDAVGGLVGDVDADANIDSSYNTGAVSGAFYVGGLVGYVNNNASITSSHNTGPVSGSGNGVSGLAGWVNANANINSSYNIGPVSGSSNVGGLVGRVVANANITSSYNTGPVSGGNYVGGLVSYVNNGDANITSSHNTGAVSGNNAVGGLVGYVSFSANINSSHNTGAVSGNNAVGGLVSYVDATTTITSSYNTGPVSGSDFVGGLVGLASAETNIDSSYNTGTISGTLDVGGLVGRVVSNAHINTSYNIGPVSGSSNVGGLAGYVFANANITFSYNTGTASGTTDVDGLAGKVFGTVTTTSAYTSVTSNHAASSTIADMKKASTFTGFDFTSSNPVWGFGSCTDNQGFPMLRVFAQISNYNSVACVSPPPQNTPSPGSTPAPVPVLQPLPAIDQTRIQTAAGNQQLLTGKRFDLIRSATINGMVATLSGLSATSVVLEVPNLLPGNYSLDLETSNGRISFQGLVEVVEASLNPAQVGSTFSVISELNPRSSWLNRTALAELEEIFKGQSVVTCISYNDRPGVITRKKALSRAMHACRIADQLGIETKVFVYGKAPELADTLKILFR